MAGENQPALEHARQFGTGIETPGGAPGIHTNGEGHTIATDRSGQSVDRDAEDPTAAQQNTQSRQSTIWGG